MDWTTVYHSCLNLFTFIYHCVIIDPLTSGVVAVAAGVTATVAAPLVLSAAGFGAAGVAAGTVAAWIQTPITAAGGWFAVCQSAGVLGMAASTKVAIGATVGTVVGAVTKYIK
ncbi:interferon alpha-inducible protein 27-like protein 2A isoform X1 [Mytilus edulis]|uniref:interferon alpha-inducible protein 27-like protein 2A isoform X1 n=1 Tax=Mytilus edulis TaxID=6550 RepID=UPI0039F052A9